MNPSSQQKKTVQDLDWPSSNRLSRAMLVELRSIALQAWEPHFQFIYLYHNQSMVTYKSLITLLLTFWITTLTPPSHANILPNKFPPLFNYKEIDQPDMNYLPQWLTILTKHPHEDLDRSINNINKWLLHLNSLQNFTAKEKLIAVNDYLNQSPYIIDPSNYGVEDYWAIAKEFLDNFGDCEDYAIAKYFSLRYLNFPADAMRIVIVQDTNLGVAHAILAVLLDNDVLILDNQSDEVVSQTKIIHYVPLYSVNERQWWLHLPNEL